MGPSGSLFALTNVYGTGSNNGNVVAQVYNGVWHDYAYDGLNRLLHDDSAAWKETYAYDRFGNRAVTSRWNLPGLTGETPDDVLADYTAANNRIGAFTYDGRGNVTLVPGRWTGFNGENQIVQSTRTGQPNYFYYYDGDGRRVATWDGGGGWNIFVYDAFGQLAAEYSTATGLTEHIYGPEHVATENSSTGRRYYVQDHLGSTRLVMNSAGAVVSTHDYLPFGEEIGVGCAAVPGGVKFTGQYRDQESCLDNFVARYNSPAQGRFTSVDPSRASVVPGNPQTWNRYTYTLNNPLALVDRNGLWSISVHHELLSVLYSGRLSQRQIALLQKVSDDQDSKRNQLDDRAYKHGQCAPRDGKCVERINNHINSNLASARGAAEQAEGLSNEALVYLGTALHTISDRHSRWHSNPDGSPTTWSVFPRWWPSNIIHAVREPFDNDYWWGLGQALRDMATNDVNWLGPYSALGGNTNAAVHNAVNGLINRQFNTPGELNWGRHGEQDAARACALGNPAACIQ